MLAGWPSEVGAADNRQGVLLHSVLIYTEYNSSIYFVQVPRSCRHRRRVADVSGQLSTRGWTLVAGNWRKRAALAVRIRYPVNGHVPTRINYSPI